MKLFITTTFVFFILGSFAGKCFAKTPKAELKTNVEFDPMTVHGRYQYSTEGKAQVEDEKVLYDLLGPRKNFKDRIQQMAQQKKRGSQ